MKRLYGSSKGLKKNQIRRIENLHRRRTPPQFIFTPELGRDLSRLSHEIRRQLGLLIDRKGRVAAVIIGDHHGIVIPQMREYRTAPGRLKGVRCIHTHLDGQALTRDDLNDLVLMQLDLMAAISVDKNGLPGNVHVGHILPGKTDGLPYSILDPIGSGETDIGCDELIRSLEAELAHTGDPFTAGSQDERALLVSVTTAPRQTAMDALDELEELVLSSGIQVIDKILQQRKTIDSKFLIGSGKLQELTILALQQGATLIVFDHELNPSQIRSITDRIELKVIDRTQLILDIFAQRARTREGKLQVELAQLKYLLPRLVTKNTAMSRLTGGIGGRGPGETKLEISRRRIRTRISQLENSLSLVRRRRHQQKSRRVKRDLPVISIIGYTNAGKSTLLNTLTSSRVLAEKRLFATLDPSSRRLRFPRDTQVIITDTVGFIKDLPEDLVVAFRATLEELESADILLHVIDISNPRCLDQIRSVENILTDLNLHRIPEIRVLNKQDIVSKETLQKMTRALGGIPISAKTKRTTLPLIKAMQTMLTNKSATHHRG
ncbi:MAG: GTPase HflX [Deltaproteobacteria bacterium]|nr:GTPase HflX [Deltaproteobacteria bacterium]